MAANAIERTHQPEKDLVVIAMPPGVQQLGPRGSDFDFDKVYAILARTIEAMGLRAERLDDVYGPTGKTELTSRTIQRAAIVVFDLTLKNHTVTMQLGMSLVFGKKVIVISQDLDDVPPDFRGHRVLVYSMMYEDVQALKKSLTEQITATMAEESQEKGLYPLPSPGRVDIMPATVMQVAKDFVLVRLDDPSKPPLVMTSMDVDYTRKIADMSRWFKVGDRVDGAFVVDTVNGTAKYTRLAGQEDPWLVLKNEFAVGTVFTGTVTKVIDNLGPFVAVKHGVEGLLPEKTLSGPVPPAGSRVEVRVANLDVVNRKVGLRLNRVLTSVANTAAPKAQPLVGVRGYGRVERCVPLVDGRGGFILLSIEGRQRPAMLLCKDMSEDLRGDLADGQVDVGEEIYVEVIEVTLQNGKEKVLLRELPDPADETEVDAETEAA
ncbi:hypothetical protein [Nocardia sp. NPDC050175]|uniref:hypothetical protein n=1 Tax=Nocardia sp. NPDC050175 TaxID=3364317 RepID=UPI0037A8D29A